MKFNDYEAKHQAFIRKHLAECTVLLNYDGQFPLSQPGTIAAYGSGVRNTVKGGSGSGEVNSRYTVSIEQALEQAGFKVVSKEWLDSYGIFIKEKKKAYGDYLLDHADPNLQNPLVALLGAVMPEPEYEFPLETSADAAVYVVGRLSGEGADRKPVKGDVLLTDTEVRDILALNESYKKFMLIINTGGPVDLRPVSKVKNILVLSQLGAETGIAAADILLGKQNPSGKLTATWSAWEDYCPDAEFGMADDTHYNEGIYVGYRYFDSVGKKALYPFGYGLSYTTFELSDIKMESGEEQVGVTESGEQPTRIAESGEQEVRVTATVTNTGGYPGKEIVEVYVSVPSVELEQPFQMLAGFAKTGMLAPGGQETVEIVVKLSDLKSYSEAEQSDVLEAGDYIFRMGKSSTETTVAGKVTLEEKRIVKRVHAICREDGENREDRKEAERQDGRGMDCAAIHPIAEKLTDEELVLLSLGDFSRDGDTSVIGNAGTTVAGAAGQTALLPAHPEIKTLVMADGPAGLRLSKKYYRDENGVHSIGNGTMPDATIELMPQEIADTMRGEEIVPQGCSVEYQYATAIPVGTAIAQSWNLDFAEKCGDIVGSEMELFHIQLWLAPALNIQRSILCGRNFEYYSEDPFVSGKFAAAVTCGVEKHKNCGVVIKHFAANNQETNRMNSNSVVDERTLRDIYLRGFEICIEETMPSAVMTSYNLLNGEHTSEMKKLTLDYLRSELGYSGIVMTDWLVRDAMPANQKYPHPKAHLIAKAGGNLIMPGGQKDYDELMKARKDGEVSRNELMRNVSETLELIEKLNVSE